MIQVKNLHVRFNDTDLYNGLNFNVAQGEKVAIKGESGSGKSTLLNVLLGFVPDFEGKIIINGMPLDVKHVRRIRTHTSFVPQELQFTVFPTVKEMFYAPFGFKLNTMPGEEEINRIFDLFEISTDLLNRNIKEISGGQKQRIMLASAVLLHKPIMLLDEPTSALNRELAVKILDYLMQTEATVLAATHDEEFIKRADKIIEL